MKKIIILLILIAFNTSTVLLCSDIGLSGATFLRFGVGAKYTALAGAGITNSTDPSCIYWNAAGLGFIKSYSAELSYNRSFAEVNQSFIGATIPVDFGVFGVGINYLGTASMTRTVASTGAGFTKYEDFSNTDIAVMASFSRKLLPNASLGGTIKYINEKLYDKSAGALAFDFGFIYRMDLFDLGLSLRNLGSSLKFQSESYSLPMQVQAGASSRALDPDLDLSIVFGTLGDQKVQFGLGAEYYLAKFLFIRAGYNTGYTEIQGTIKGLSAGVGFKYDNFDFGLALTPYGSLGNSYHFSLSYGIPQTTKNIPDEAEPVKDIIETPKQTNKQPDVLKAEPLRTFEKGKCFGILFNSYDSRAEAEQGKTILLNNNVYNAIIIENSGTNTVYQLIAGCYDNKDDALAYLNSLTNITKKLGIKKKPIVIR
ncbi:MAG: PorV/PorQ family protein [Candidatus Kapabacteria bacterium]|nr:PorV/PorQ family protein [Candidatus Kapabacteria bacterium]